MKNTVFVCAAAALLWAAPAWADHCDVEIADVDWGLANGTGLNPNAVEAAAALREEAVAFCGQEEDELAAAPADSPLADPNYVSLGGAYLIVAKRLLGGE